MADRMSIMLRIDPTLDTNEIDYSVIYRPTRRYMRLLDR